MMGFQLCLQRISSCPRIAFPFFMNRTQFGLCILNLSREEKGRLTALLKATHMHLCCFEWKRTLQHFSTVSVR